jgi:putative spermidine/putrescine transport system ATP-binding protein
MTGTMLSLRAVSHRYGQVLAVDDVSLDVAEGEFLSLLGPSGCGKTTLLRMIAGFVEPARGEILVAGKAMRGVPPAARNLGLVFQNYSLWPHMTVAENVAFGLAGRGLARNERRARVEECLSLVQLEGMAGRYPKELSGGQQQRVALARALAYRPTLLLLDEPLSALDRKLRVELQSQLRRLQRELGVTTILVTHDQDEAIGLSNRIAVLRAGRIEHLGTPPEVYTRPATAFVAEFMGRASLLDGIVVMSTEGTRFEIDGGGMFRLSGGNPVAGRARLLLRPEMVELVPAGHGDTTATIEDVIFAGSAHDIVLRLPGGRTVVASRTPTASETSASPGDTVGLTIAAAPALFGA